MDISGNISTTGRLQGTVSAGITLSGAVTVPASVGTRIYEGDYEVTPKAYDVQTLATANRLMEQDVTVFNVPYYETSNQTGETVYIAIEV